MKNTIKTIGFLLVFLTAGNSISSAQNCMGMGMGMGMGLRNGNGGCPCSGIKPGNPDGLERGRGNAFRAPLGLGGMMFANLPDLTDKQKTEISDLRQKHQKEMSNLRIDIQYSTDISKKNEIASGMDKSRESFRASVLNILTKEQKDFINSKLKNIKDNQVNAPMNGRGRDRGTGGGMDFRGGNCIFN